MPHGAPDLEPAAVGKGGGFLEEDLSQGREVNTSSVRPLACHLPVGGALQIFDLNRAIPPKAEPLVCFADKRPLQGEVKKEFTIIHIVKKNKCSYNIGTEKKVPTAQKEERHERKSHPDCTGVHAGDQPEF